MPTLAAMKMLQRMRFLEERGAAWAARRSSAPRCARCGAQPAAGQKLRLCGGCKAVRYCGAECQRADWTAHRPRCLQAQGVAQV